MTNNAIPAHAERVDLMAIYRTRRQPSKFCPSVEAVVAYFECPSCHKAHEHPGLDPLKCSCGLSMQSDGAGIAIWRDAPATATAE